uniref:Uncharacterized protein n=1 Tax=Nelumbo nucifera TaxID=4432 RepID=A0A822ZMA8_NELNU|nr:TPA_asm: hypothetical protein HUJ06_004123 [Nelumbo nucifera]
MLADHLLKRFSARKSEGFRTSLEFL